MEPIRVLQVVTSMNMGGIENFLMNYYRHIDRTKVQFDFLKHRSDKSYFDDEIISMGGRIFNVPSINPLHHFEYLKALDSFFVHHPEYKIIHTNIGANGIYVLRAAKRNLIPIRIAQSHCAPDKMIHLGIRAPFVYYAMRNIAKHNTHNFACGDAAGRWLFGKRSNYAIIPNAIDTSLFSLQTIERCLKRNELNTSNALTIGHVGSFTRVKNHSLILSIFYEIVHQHPNTILLLIGDGKLRETMKHQAQEMKLADKVRFLGIRSDVSQLMQAMDLFLFPSLFEGLGIVLIEAQTAGLPCLASDRVPKDAQVTDLLEYMPLEEPAERWARKLLQMAKDTPRRDRSDEVKAAGYDVSENARWLQDFYLTCHAETKTHQ